MPALMWKKDSQGKLIGRCDKRCYDSKKPDCHCICDGVNHGAGFHEAIERTAIHFHELHGKDGITVAAKVNECYFDWTGGEQPS